MLFQRSMCSQTPEFQLGREEMVRDAANLPFCIGVYIVKVQAWGDLCPSLGNTRGDTSDFGGEICSSA
ncbi:MAG: hypothetical protein AAFY57_16420 [Cyanobacteria bacterium J06642_2]